MKKKKERQKDITKDRNLTSYFVVVSFISQIEFTIKCASGVEVKF